MPSWMPRCVSAPCPAALLGPRSCVNAMPDGSNDDSRDRRARLLGPQPAAQLHGGAGRLREVGLRPATGGAGQGPPALPVAVPSPPTYEVVLADDARGRRRHRHADLHALRTRQGRPRGRQARVRREADDGSTGRGRGAGRARGAHRPHAHGRPHLRVQPAGAQARASSSHAGELGDIHFITSSRVNLGLHQKDVSVIWDLAPHDLSASCYYWLGEAAASV